MDIAGYWADNGANIATYFCEAAEDQAWFMDTKPDGWFYLRSKKNGRCVDVAGYEGRGNVGTWDCEWLAD